MNDGKLEEGCEYVDIWSSFINILERIKRLEASNKEKIISIFYWIFISFESRALSADDIKESLDIAYKRYINDQEDYE